MDEQAARNDHRESSGQAAPGAGPGAAPGGSTVAGAPTAGEPGTEPAGGAQPAGGVQQQPDQAGGAPQAPGQAGDGIGVPLTWSLRRTTRTVSSEVWDGHDGDGDRFGTVGLQYAAGGVEGMLAMPGEMPDEHRRAVLGWVSELLALDETAGPGGTIHWVTVSGTATDYWRRAPGRRPTGADRDLTVVRSRVESVLTSTGKEYGVLPDGEYAVDIGSVRVFVAVRLVDTSVAVRVFAITNLDVAVDGDLPAYLLHLNFTMAIGRFSLDVDRHAVWCDHLLVGDDVDDSSLERVVAAIAGTADKYDDEIKQRYGGRTFREEGSPVGEALKLGPGSRPDMAGGYL